MENAASRFGQHLAHTEKKYRDRAFKKLSVYLTKKINWTPIEWDKLWKALFYCMWMSDKRQIQDELSTKLAALVHNLPSPELVLQFVHSFFRTMQREWHGIDGLRLDKFYTLVRKFIRETVVFLRHQQWNQTYVQTFTTILSTEILSQLPNGLRMHVADVYLIEIHTAAGKDVTTAAFLSLLEPFVTLLRSEYNVTVCKRICDVVFAALAQSFKFQGPDLESQDETDGEEETTRVFACVDLAAVQHRLFALASADDVAERNRGALYALYQKLRAITHVDSLQAVQILEKPANEALLSTTKDTMKTFEEDDTATESGVSTSDQLFPRCSGCGGFGRGLLSKHKALCGHCTRQEKARKKEATRSRRKRKAETRTVNQNLVKARKVTFGRSKALRHGVSVKRLKASATRSVVSKDKDELKSVLKGARIRTNA